MLKWLAVLLLGTLAAAPQQIPTENSATQPGSAPTFRAGIRLVEVDVIARDKNGPVAGLTKADFTLLDDGKPREIAVFSVKSPQPSGHPKSSLPPGIVSNRVSRDGETLGSGTVVLMDQKNLPVNGQADAIQQIGKFIEARRKNDRIGIYTLTKDGVTALQDLTDDTGLLRTAARSLKPLTPAYRTCDPVGKEPPDCGMSLLTERAMDTKHAFEGVARHLSGVPGRKSLIWITASFPLRQARPRGNNPDYDFTPDMQAAGRALSDAGIALYAVDARALTTNGKGIYPVGFDTMDLVTELTGGGVFINTNAIAESIESAVEDGDLVYTLGFYPAPDEKEAAPHKLKVEVARKGVSLRYRESYVAAKTQVTATDHQAVEELIHNPLDAAQIELAARAIPDQTHPGSYRVQVSVNLHDVQFQHQGSSWVGELGVAFLVEGTEEIREITRKLEFSDAQLAANIERGTLIETTIAPSSPKGILRIAVQDHATGAAGSLRLPLGAQ